ncbi:MAG: hypothetical protein AAF351_02400 [Pseudomonadota bacterium]
MTPAVVALLGLLAWSDVPDCGDNASTRTVIGAQPIASRLYQNLQNIESGAWRDGTFHTERFDYIGTLLSKRSTKYVGYLVTTWGAACRATVRVVFFDEDYWPIGQYGGLPMIKPSIEGDSLVWKGDGFAEHVDLTEGLPTEIFVDGITYRFSTPSQIHVQ